MLADRVESKQKQIADLESKAQSLQLALDRQSTILAKTAEEGSVQKDKVQQLNLSLTDQSAMIQELQDKLSQVQKVSGGDRPRFLRFVTSILPFAGPDQLGAGPPAVARAAGQDTR